MEETGDTGVAKATDDRTLWRELADPGSMSAQRLGLIVPSSNTVAEPDFYRHLPPHISLHTARMYLRETTAEAEITMLDEHLPQAITDLATTRPDVVVFGCTSAGTLRGNTAEQRLIELIASKTESRTISVAAAIRDAIRSHNANSVGVVTPYVETLNDKIRASLTEDGFDVPAIHGMGIEQNLKIGTVEPEQIVEFARTHFDTTSGIDLLFASCTNWRALEAREQIEHELGVPVLTSNQAALEAALDGLSDRWGRAPARGAANPG